MTNRLNTLLSMLNALPEQRIEGRDYEPVQGQLLAIHGTECVERFDFTCAMDDYADVVTKYYTDCQERGLTTSFAWSAVQIKPRG